MFTKRTDLAIEAHELWQESAGKTTRLAGVKATEKKIQGYPVTQVDILDREGEAALGKPVMLADSIGTGNQGGEFDYNSVDFNANMDIRNEIVRLTNEVRKENGVSELPTDSAVMNAAQAAAEYYAMSGDGWNGHNSQVERDCRKKAGMTYGSMTNLTGSTSSNRSTVAKESVTNWVNSDVHFQAMIDATADNIGVGVAIDANGYFWCVQVFGDYESIS